MSDMNEGNILSQVVV